MTTALSADFLVEGLSALTELANSSEVPFDVKWKMLSYFMEKYAHVAEMAGNKARCCEKDQTFAQSEKSNKFSEMTMTQNKKKECKDLINQETLQVENIKKTGAQILEEEKNRAVAIKARYDEAIQEIKDENPVDEELQASLESDNKDLRAKAMEASESVKKMEEDYKGKIQSLKSHCETNDKTFNEKVESLKSPLETIDKLKKGVKENEDKSRQQKIRAGYLEKRLKECKGILDQTKSSLDNFINETKSIVAKAKTQVEKLNVHRDAFDTYNDGILQVVNENSDIEVQIKEKQKVLSELKDKCKQQMGTLAKLKK